jgi:suppressor for copper-sensitivity B
MTIVRVLLTVLAASLFLVGHENRAAAQEPAVSEWAVEGAARVRLVAGGLWPDGSLKAGLEFRLEPGWKTYWVNPGPTGLPPRLNFAGSGNFSRGEPFWPAPVRFDDGGTSSVGYSGTLVVPLRIEAQDAAKPVSLKLAVDYGLCEKICIPAHADLELRLVPGMEPDKMIAAQFKAFEARVPRGSVMGDKGALAVTGAGRTMAGLEVDVRFPKDAAVTDLFAGSSGVSVGVPQKLQSGAWRIKLRSGPAPKIVDLVAVADGAAIKVPLALDDLPSRP